MEELSKQANALLNHKKVVILGGSAGIGLATAKAAAAQGGRNYYCIKQSAQT
jgi:NAD(P)-dependent dehydrogenase (short-subunit alcohol dehydrogenase family)